MKKIYEYKHVVWDWNGTLLNDFLLCVDCLNEQLKKLNLPPCTPERYREIFEFPLINVYRTLGFPVNDAARFHEICVDFMNAYERRRGNCHLHDGARAFIHKVCELGLTQSVFSAYSHQKLAPVLAEYDLNLYFSCFSGSNDLSGNKIDRGPAHLRELGFAPRDVLYIGDTTHDIEAAKRMNVDCVVIYHGELAQMSLPRISGFGAPVINNYNELL